MTTWKLLCDCQFNWLQILVLNAIFWESIGHEFSICLIQDFRNKNIYYIISESFIVQSIFCKLLSIATCCLFIERANVQLAICYMVWAKSCLYDVNKIFDKNGFHFIFFFLLFDELWRNYSSLFKHMGIAIERQGGAAAYPLQAMYYYRVSAAI